MSLSPASTERIKLAATFFNSLGVALVSLGVFAPLIYQATTTEAVVIEKRALIYGVIGICVTAAIALHFSGQAMLSFLETPTPQEADDDRQ